MSGNRFVDIILIVLLSLFMVTGCASFSGKQLPIYNDGQLPAPDKKISATYDLKAYRVDTENSTLSESLEKKIQEKLPSSPIFSELKPGPGEGDYHFSFVFRNEGTPPEVVAFLNGFVTGFTFGLIPAFARDTFILTVDVKQGERVIKNYAYEDHMDTWIQLFLVFLTPFNFPTSVADSVVENMVMNFAYDFSSDIESGAYEAIHNQRQMTAIVGGTGASKD